MDNLLDIADTFCRYNPIFYNAWMLGYPQLSKEIETACVRFNETGDAIVYMFNPDFMVKLNETERRFVFAHEILHIFLKHGYRNLGNPLNQHLANIAMDLVVNHMLLDTFGFTRDSLDYIKDNMCFFDTVFPSTVNISELEGKSFEHYYNLLKKHANKININMVCLSKNIGVSNNDIDKLNEELTGYLDYTLDNETKQKLNDTLKKQTNEQKAGTGNGNTLLKIYVEVKKRKTWEKLIKNIVTKHYTETSIDRWAPKNRRIQHLSTDLFLPSAIDADDIDKYKPEVWVFLDTSGSCYKNAQKFYKALKSIPEEKFIVRKFGFSTSVYEIKNDELKDFGGTSFSIIEEYIQNIIQQHNTSYPSLVFIMTDGYGDYVFPEHPKRWHWFLTLYSSQSDIPVDSPRYQLSEFNGQEE